MNLLTAIEQEELHDELLPRMLALPYVITIENAHATFHVAHAELMLSDVEIREERLSRMRTSLTWARRLIREVNPDTSSELETPAGALYISHQPWEPGLSLTFVGHTPIVALIMHRSHLFIDGGAYLGESDSCLRLLDVAEVRSWITKDFPNSPPWNV